MADNSVSLLFKIDSETSGVSVGTAKAKAEFAALRSSFGSELKTMETASAGALRGISLQVSNLVRQVPIVGPALAGITREVTKAGESSSKVDVLTASYKKFQTTLAEVASGKAGASAAAGELKNLGIVAEQALKKPEQAFQTFLIGLRGMKSEAGQATTAANVLGASTSSKLIPALAGAETQATSLGPSLAGLALPIGAVVIGITAAAVAAVAFVKTMLDLATKTANYGESVYKASQKTALSVETVSALKIAADRVGLSIDFVSTGLVRFTNNLAKAQAGNKTFANEFAQLGVKSFNDNDKALSEFLAHFATLRTDQERTLAASQIFGVRVGASFVELFRLIGGDMDKFKTELRDMGLLMDTEAARSSHNFNVLYKQVSEQFSALTRQIGFQVMPVFAAMFIDSSKSLKENQAEWKHWGDIIAGVLLTIRGETQALAMTIKQSFTTIQGAMDLFVPGATIVRFVQNLRAISPGLIKAVMDVNEAAGLGDAMSEGLPKSKFGLPEKTTKAKKAGTTDPQYKVDLEASAEAAKKELETQRHLTEQLKLAHEESLVDLEQYYTGKQKLIDQHFNTEIDQINRDQAAVDEARARGRIKAAEADKEDAKLEQQTLEAKNKLSEESHRLSFEREQARDKASRDLENQLLAIRDAQREGELDRIKTALDREQITESEAIVRRLAVEKQAYEDRKTLIDLELSQLSTSADRKIELDNLKILSEQRYTNAVDRATAERIAAQKKELKEQFDAQNEPAKGATRQRRATGIPIGPEGKQQFGTSIAEAFHVIQKAVRDAGGEIGKFHAGLAAVATSASAFFAQQSAAAGNFTSIMQNAAVNVVSGLADLAKQWILTGHVSSVELRKMVAETLASITQQAIIKAAWEGAEALAEYATAVTLAANPFTAFLAPGHFAAATGHGVAAAAYAALGGGAAILGRAAAGDLFSQAGAMSSGGGSGSASSSTSLGSSKGSSGGPTVIDAQRNVIKFVLEQHIVHSFKGGNLHSEVEKSIIKSARGNSVQLKTTLNQFLKK